MQLIVEVIPAGGLGHGPPLRLPASQVVVRLDDGTPILVAACYGPDGAHAVGSVAHDAREFHATLRRLGITDTVLVTDLPRQAAPAGARLLVQP